MEVPNESGDAAHAIELVAPAVSSPPLASTSEDMQKLVARALTEQSHIKYADGLNNGYLVVDLNTERARAEWHFTGNRTQHEEVTLGHALECKTGTNALISGA
jgi:hypothetical protein